jgi:hypothetical protein
VSLQPEAKYAAEVTAEDVSAFGAALRREMLLPRGEAIAITCALLTAFLALHVVAELVAGPLSTRSYILGGLGAGIAIGCGLLLVRRRTWRRWETSRAFQLGAREYVLRGDELDFRSPLGTFALWLPAIGKIGSFPRVVLFYLDEHTAHFMPKSAFASPDEESAFLQIVRSRIRSADRVT